MALPLFIARQKGGFSFRFRNAEVAENESATYAGGNPHLREALLFSRDSTLAALPLLIVGTSLLILEALR